MSLEDIVMMYGWNDYLDMDRGYIFKLSSANKDEEKAIAHVQIEDAITHEPIGVATMKLMS